LRELPFEPDELEVEQLSLRLPAVLSILYLLFTEGYLSSHADGAIRRELCDDAKRLTQLLAEHSASATPETFALLALMHLHSARITARQDAAGGLLLLEEQDRSVWDQREIQLGLSWLARSAEGDAFCRYHAEAGVAAEHCLAPSFAETRWDRIVECYALLEQLAPSAMHTLNRAVAMAEWRGPIEGLAILEGLQPPSWLAGSYLWAAVLTDLHRRCGHDELAKRYRDAALASAPSLPVKNALARRLRTEDSWGPRPVTCSYAEVDLRVGGGYRIVNALPDGTSVVIEGEFEQIEPPHKLVYTWRMGPEHPELSRVTVHFEARGDATEVIVVHEQIASRALRDSHEHGWRGCLDGLARHFA
jgi:uncharacterized protein YndB with AHSA1/START domain